MADAYELMKQFRKGVAYFNSQYENGMLNPVVKRQAAVFEQAVMIPLDQAAAKLDKETRVFLESGIG